MKMLIYNSHIKRYILMAVAALLFIPFYYSEYVSATGNDEIVIDQTVNDELVNNESVNSDGAVYSNEPITIALDPGHGGEEKGADYYGSAEKDINLKIALLLKDKLSVYDNVNVFLTRETDEVVSLKERVDRAAAAGADIFISLHCNASVSHISHGASVYVSTGEANRKKLCDMADLFLGEFENIGLDNAGTFARVTQMGGRRADGSFDDYYGVLRHSYNNGIPAMIVEHCYVDAVEDRKYITDEGCFDKLVSADANAIAAYYGLIDKAGNRPEPKHAKKYGATTKAIKMNYFDPPKLNSVKLTGYSGKSPDMSTFEVDISDDIGVNYIYLVYKNSAGNSMTVSLDIGKSLTTGVYELKGYVPANLVSDRYTLSYVGLYNDAGFDAGYNYSGGELIGFGKCDWTNSFAYYGEAALNVTGQGSLSMAQISSIDNKIKLGILQRSSARPGCYYLK